MKRRILSLLLALALCAGLASGCFAANYSSWFKSTYDEIHKLESIKNCTILPKEFESMDLKQNITRAEMCLLAVQAFEAATGNDI